jgi:hypothetical protein
MERAIIPKLWGIFLTFSYNTQGPWEPTGGGKGESHMPFSKLHNFSFRMVPQEQNTGSICKLDLSGISRVKISNGV